MNNIIKRFLKYAYFIFLMSIFHLQAAKKELKIVSSIYPIQQIVNEIYGAETELVIDSYLSPHQYSLKPSDIALINKADLFIWVGEGLFPQGRKYVNKRLQNTLQLSEIASINLLEDSHESESHTHGDLDYNPHIWLSFENSTLIARKVSEELSLLDVENKHKYLSNLKDFLEKAKIVKANIESQLSELKKAPYFTFHDAYSYFENEFSLSNKGILRVNITKSIKAKTMYKLQKKIKAEPKACLFYEPQFDKRIVEQLAFKNKIGILDPIGYKKKSIGFFAILTNLADSFEECLR